MHEAGLRRVTVSLDALDDTTFRAMNDVDFPVDEVLAGIDAAARAGLGPLKINMVVKRGVNDDQVVEMARHFRGTGHILRFIEFMDVGASNGWRMSDVVPSAELVARLDAAFGIEPLHANYVGEVAERSALPGRRRRDRDDLVGDAAVLPRMLTGAAFDRRSPLHLPFRDDRLTSFRTLLRAGHDDAEIASALAGVWRNRSDRYRKSVRARPRSSERSK